MFRLAGVAHSVQLLCYGLDDRFLEGAGIRYIRHCVQTGSGAQPDSFFFSSRVKAAGK